MPPCVRREKRILRMMMTNCQRTEGGLCLMGSASWRNRLSEAVRWFARVGPRVNPGCFIACECEDVWVVAMGVTLHVSFIVFARERLKIARWTRPERLITKGADKQDRFKPTNVENQYGF